MTNYSKRVIEMLVRVQMFWNEHPELIDNDPTLTRQFQQIDETLEQFGTHATRLTSGKAKVVVSTMLCLQTGAQSWKRRELPWTRTEKPQCTALPINIAGHTTTAIATASRINE
jgi:hypothetical protein